MASTYSPSLRIELMATGDQSGTWGDTTNTNLGTLLEQAITGVLSVAQGNVANLTLTSLDGTSDQARNMVLNLTGAMTAGRNVVVPTANKVYLIKNSTTGGFAVTVKTAAGSGVTVPATTARWVYCDGTNVVDGMSGPWAPSSNDAQALGLSGTAWADLFLASGGVINWNAGDVTITHSSNLLAFAGASSGYTFDAGISGTTAAMTGTISSTGSSVGFTAFQAVSTEAAAAAGPIVNIYRNSASPAANDILGRIVFNGRDSAGNTQEYASIEAVIADPVSGSEDAALDFYIPVAGARTKVLSIGPTAVVAVGGSQVLVRSDSASQADQETATSTVTFVSPGRQQFHPSAIKAWGYVTVSGGTPTLQASYNLTSITDSGVGVLGVTIATDFSSANYSGVGTVEATGGINGWCQAGPAASPKTAGVMSFQALQPGPATFDPTSWNVMFAGDQ